jgi:hypothetical protein
LSTQNLRRPWKAMQIREIPLAGAPSKKLVSYAGKFSEH